MFERGEGSCNEYSSRFVVPCRASDASARTTTATFYPSFETGVFVDTVFRAWFEVYLAGYGWVPVDVTCDNLLRPGTCDFS